MTDEPARQTRLRVAHLNPRAATPFDLQPDPGRRAAIAADLGLLDLPALRLTGDLRPERGEAWLLTARLTARVVQPCVVTLAPVATDIDESVRRVFSPHVADGDEAEAEMPDDEVEPLDQHIDLGAVMAEALSLALPLYPRAPGAAFDDPGEAPPRDEDRQRPFAGLNVLLGGRDQG